VVYYLAQRVKTGLGTTYTRTSSGLVASLCGLLPLRFELTCRCSGFIVKCLNSSNSIVRFVARQGVLHQQWSSPIGRNAQHSATLLESPLSKLASINKKMAWTTVNSRVLSDSDFFKYECHSREVTH